MAGSPCLDKAITLSVVGQIEIGLQAQIVSVAVVAANPTIEAAAEAQIACVAVVSASPTIAVGLGTPATDWQQRWAQLQRDLRSLRRRSSGGLTRLKVTRKRDRLFTFLVDAYHLKDLLKDASGSTGIPRQAVENAVTNDRSLALLADLANLNKHGQLDRPPRSGDVPTITSVEGVTVAGGWQLRLSISHSGTTIDGVTLAGDATKAWRRELKAWGLL